MDKERGVTSPSEIASVEIQPESPDASPQEQPPKKKRIFSPEHRAAISKAHKGKKLSPEHRAAISKAHKGKKLSPEHRAAISKALKGKRHTPATLEKMSKAARERWKDPAFRKKMAELYDWQIPDEAEKELWECATENNLLPQMIKTSIISEEEMEILKGFFDGEGGKPSENLIDRFSIALAHVA